MILHLTNGSSAGDLIAASGIGGEVVCWDDALHDGPVPAGLSLDELSDLRAAFLAGESHEEIPSIRHALARRNASLMGAKAYSEVVLWFEHDLFDQLQLIQILDQLASTGIGWTRVTLVQEDRYLGLLDAEEIRAAFPARREATRQQFVLASESWQAFCSAEPLGLLPFFEVNPALPYLGPALRRFAEEYPWTTDGLNRTERQILTSVSQGIRQRNQLFHAFSTSEEPKWMGDLTFWARLDSLLKGAAPLLTSELTLTPKGQAVLDGIDDRVRGNGIDLWMGGVHLKGEDSPWRWDPTQARFVSRP